VVDLVIGSGPSGVSAAHALLAQGRQVLMIDAGETLEPEQEALRARMASSPPEAWDPADLARARHEVPGEVRRYGSDHFFRDPEGLMAAPGLELKPSYALGGLSNAWGSAVLPYGAADMAGWPIGPEDLAAHYRAVAGFMPMSGEADDLQALFPALDAQGLTPLPASTQAEALLARLRAQAPALAREGVVAGRARQAAAPGCVRCGLCLQGCPYRLVFNAGDAVATLRGRPGFEYRGGLRAVRFGEDADGAWVAVRDTAGDVQQIRGERLFVATGVLPTAQLVLASLGEPHDEVILKDSQHLFLPMLHSWGTDRDPVREPHHALTQVFVEMSDAAVSPFPIHAQLYTYNPVYAADMKARYGRRLPFLNPLFGALGRRLIVAQMFLHSDHSHGIGLTLTGDGKLASRIVVNPAMEAVAGRARAKLGRAMRRAGLMALASASRLGAPGSSFHAGASFPMSSTPTGFQTDTLGRPAGLQRVHLVDASVLPAVPATTITLSVMANAHRIASKASHI
jgi:choline dehydrogenase-like flavoprotein